MPPFRFKVYMSKKRAANPVAKITPALRPSYPLDPVEVEAIGELSKTANQHAHAAEFLLQKAQQEKALAEADAQRAQGIIQIAARRRGIDPSKGNWVYRDGCLKREG